MGEPVGERGHDSSALLQLLHYPKNTLFVFFVFLALLVSLGYLFIAERNTAIDVIEKERQGLAYIDRLRGLLKHVQKHRGMSLLVGSEDTSKPTKLAEIRSIVDQSFFALYQIDEHFGATLQVGDRLERLIRQWSRIKTGESTMTASENFEAHSKLAAGLIALKSYIVDNSGLIQEPDIDGYYMVDLVAIQLPALTERIGHLRAIGTHLQANESTIADARLRLAFDLERVEERNSRLRHNLRIIFNIHPRLETDLSDLVGEAEQGVAQFSGLIREILDAEELTISGEMVFERGSETIDKLYTIYDHVIPTLDALLQTRIEEHRRARMIMIGGILAVMLVILYLLTSRIRLEQQVEERTRGLKAMNRELEAFSYSVAHDLRSPLRAINAFSQILNDEQADCLTDEGKRYLGRIQVSTLQMAHLIDGLLDLSKVYRSEMVPKKVDLSAMARNIADALHESDPGRRVAFQIAPGLIAQGDREWLQVLLQNLLENAWKFTAPQPEPRIEFGAYSDSGETIFYVADNGVGFDAQFSHKLFNPFERLHDEREFVGTGIGLATVRRIVERHGGRVWAKGEPGAGATFYFSLPTISRPHHGLAR